MKFKLTCQECDNIMDLEGTIHIDRFKCNACGADIELRPGRMEEGVRIAGKYQTLFKTNDDGYSSSYICKDLNNDELHLLRIYDKTLTKLISDPESFMELVGAVSFMGGENHMPIIDTGVSNQYMFQVMPFRKLESLEQLIEFGYVWEVDQALDLVYELVKSLEEGAKKIGNGHFNLNPNNIFISSKGKVRYQGFGVAPQLFGEKTFVDSDFQVFDIHYISPEMAQGKAYPSQASDIYSLGMILYYMITGTTPRVGNEDEVIDYGELVFPDDLKSELNQPFLNMFNSMIEVDPTKRIQTFTELKNRLINYFEKIDHLPLNQMEGEKTDLYKSDLFRKKVVELLNPLKEYNLKSIDPTMSSNTVRQRMATQTTLDIQLDLSEKLQNPKRVRRRRLNATANPKRIQRSASSRTSLQVEETSSKAPYFIVAFIVVSFALTALIFSIMPDEKADPVPLVVENEKILQLDTDKANEPDLKEALPEKKDININFFDKELSKAEPDFEKLDSKYAKHLAAANDDDLVILEGISKKINEAKQDAQRRLIIELKSQASTAFFKKRYSEATEIYSNYQGPFLEETKEIRDQLLKELEVKIAQQKVTDSTEERDRKLDSIIDENDRVFAIVENLFDKEYLLAKSALNELNDLYGNDKLKILTSLIEKSSKETLEKDIMSSLAVSDIKSLNVVFNGESFSGTIVSCDLDEGLVELNLSLGNSNIRKQYGLAELETEELVKWIGLNEDASTKSFMAAVYSTLRDDLAMANKLIKAYDSVYSDVIKDELKKRLTKNADDEMLALFDTYNYPYLAKEQKKLDIDDQIAFAHQLKNLLSKYDSDVNFKGGNDYFSLLLDKLEASNAIVNETIFVDPSMGIDKINMYLNEKYDTVRLLPGIYEGDLTISKRKLNLIGTKGVVVKGNIVVLSSNNILSKININGKLLALESKSGLEVKHCFINGGLFVRENAGDVSVFNSIIHGVDAVENKELSFKNCVLLKPINYSNNVVAGRADYEFVNCIILSSDTLIFFDTRFSKKGDFKNCLLYTPNSLSRGHQAITFSLEEADGKVGDFDKCIFAKPKFVSQKDGDYRLMESSPGYMQGYRKQNIGVSMNDDLDLR